MASNSGALAALVLFYIVYQSRTATSSTPFTQEVLFNPEVGLVTPGAFHEYLPSPVFYDSMIPTIFQYLTPQWNQSDITFVNWFHCENESFPYSHACPITYNLNKVISNLHMDFDGLHPVADAKTQSEQHSKENYFQRLTSHSDFCDKIQKHFGSIWTDPGDLEYYLNELQGCFSKSKVSINRPIGHVIISNYSYNIRQPFISVENNFYDTFYNPIQNMERQESILILASSSLQGIRTSVQGVMLSHFYAEKNRWVHANQDCRQGYIPTSLVTPDKFNESLSYILSLSMFKNDLVGLSIPTGEISKYYSIPLTDCTHTPDSLVVRVLTPTLSTKWKENLQLVSVHWTPFKYQNSVCRIKLAGEIGGTEMQTWIYDGKSQKAYLTSCKSNELCKISESLLGSQRSDHCVSAMISRNEAKVRRYCNLECFPTEEYVLPIVVSVAVNTFVVVTDAPLTLQIACRTGRELYPSEKEIPIKGNQEGAIMVELGCHCQMNLPNFSTFHGGHSCENVKEWETVSKIYPILPLIFTRANVKLAMSTNDTMSLSELIDRERLGEYLKSPGTKDDDSVHTSSEKLLHTYCDEGNQLRVLWCVFIVTVAVLVSVQAYIIVTFKRFEKVSYSKDSRILFQADSDTTLVG